MTWAEFDRSMREAAERLRRTGHAGLRIGRAAHLSSLALKSRAMS